MSKELPFSFGTEPLIGWRVWNLDGTYLHSVAHEGIWPHRKAKRAHCARSLATHDDSPQANCYCGIWAMRSVRDLSQVWRYYGRRCFGELYLWGRIIESERGYRAQYAYPRTLYVSVDQVANAPQTADTLARGYGVPTDALDLPQLADMFGQRAILKGASPMVDYDRLTDEELRILIDLLKKASPDSGPDLSGLIPGRFSG